MPEPGWLSIFFAGGRIAAAEMATSRIVRAETLRDRDRDREARIANSATLASVADVGCVLCNAMRPSCCLVCIDRPGVVLVASRAVAARVDDVDGDHVRR